MTKFENVHPSLEKALTNRGFETLTPVQTSVIDAALEGQDLLVSSQTGSGKTVAFGLACASTLLGQEEHFGPANAPLALVIAPTRELALQVQKELEWLFMPARAMVISCVGGMDLRTERRALKKGAHIVVGTPGRLCDHIDKGHLDVTTLHAVVLDEADEMLDMGFRDELENILKAAPTNRRTLMFSATVPKPIVELAKRYQKDAKRVATQSDSSQHNDIEYKALTVPVSDRLNAIVNILSYQNSQNTIIFCGTRAAVAQMKSRLTERGLSVVALSGELSQKERSAALQLLRDGRASVCVATDVAARGIDLPGLGLVIHADLPKNKDILLHRSGRTGRAGAKGTCVIIAPTGWRSRVERLLSHARIKATWIRAPSVEEITKLEDQRFMANPIFTEPMTESETAEASKLLEAFSPEQIASALLRLNRKSKPKIVKTMDSRDDDRRDGRAKAVDFNDSVWLSLNVGRKDTAEPRWIVPMMCGAGNMTKSDIGTIRILEEETYVQLSSAAAEQFFNLVADGSKLEKNIYVRRLDRAPAGASDGGDRRPGKFGGNKKKKFGGSAGGSGKPFGAPRGAAAAGATRRRAAGAGADRKPRGAERS